MTTVAVEDLAISRGERMLFRTLSFRVAAGEAVALVGANGAGKTSLLRAVAGLLRPAAGAVQVEPEETGLHFVGHQDGLKGGRTASEELRFWAAWFGGSRAGADAALERLDLARLAALEVRRLSAGQRRRLAVARLLAAPRPVWLLDEPMAPLDAQWRARFGEVMAEHLAGGGLILAAVLPPPPVPHRILTVGRGSPSRPCSSASCRSPGAAAAGRCSRAPSSPASPPCSPSPSARSRSGSLASPRARPGWRSP